MKMFKHALGLLLASTLATLPFAGFADENTTGHAALTEPVKSALDHYLSIQADLAKDSIQGLDAEANVIAKLAGGDEMKAPEIAKEAETLAQARDLATAREAFKPLSASLIKYLAGHKISGSYHEAYCPMVNASWLQTGLNVRNPYLGSQMLTCGELKN